MAGFPFGGMPPFGSPRGAMDDDDMQGMDPRMMAMMGGGSPMGGGMDPRMMAMMGGGGGGGPMPGGMVGPGGGPMGGGFPGMSSRRLDPMEMAMMMQGGPMGMHAPGCPNGVGGGPMGMGGPRAGGQMGMSGPMGMGGPMMGGMRPSARRAYMADMMNTLQQGLQGPGGRGPFG